MSVAPSERLAFTVREAAKLIGLGERRTGDLVRCHAIKSVPVGRRLLIPRWAIEEYLREGAS